MQDRRWSTRTLAILAVTAIAVGGFAFHFLQEDAAPERQQGTISETEAAFSPKVEEKLDKLAGILERYQQTNREQQARLNKGLADLDTRLRSLETTHAAASDGAESGKDTANPRNGTEKPGPKAISEADVGHWMDETLRAGSFDKEATELAREQAAKSVAKFPGVNLDDIQCGKGFCRATFTQESGESPEVGALFGEPPFETEGFTVSEADGRVALYFARPGESLEAFRSAAQQAAQ
jgi:hypothetical protein